MGLVPHPGPGHELAEAMRRRARTFRLARLAVLAFVVLWFLLPYEIRAWIPVWMPFLAALGLELNFFVGGWLQARQGRGHAAAGRDRGPQPRDLADFGGDQWRDAIAVDVGGEQHWVPAEGLTDEEIHDRIADYYRDPETARAEAAAPAVVAPRPGHPLRRYLVEGLVAIALVGVVGYWAVRPHGWDAVSTADRARAEAVFSRAASTIAGHPAKVGCDTSGDYVGYTRDADGLAFVGGRQAYLTPAICDTLYQLRFKERVQSFPRTARAIAVLAHEAQHLRGVTDEGLANCYGFQSGVGVGVALGLDEGEAREMMREQLATNVSDSAGNDAYLVPAGCRNGGEYDLRPGDGAFP
jgi:hypothetical protein